MRPVLYLIRKEFWQILRTREMLAILFIAPIIQTVVLGFAITNEVKHVRLIIADQDNTAISREVAAAFTHTDRFDVVGYSTDMRRIKEAIHRWEVQMAVVIPRHFQRDLRRNRQPAVQVIVDGLDGNTAGVALGYAQGILNRVARDHLGDVQFRKVLQQVHLVEMQERMWYNLDLYSPQYMVPGIVVVLLTVITMLLASMGLVREKEIGTLEQLMVTPLKKHQLLLGKLVPFIILGFLELAVVLTAAQWIFGIRLQGSYLLLAGLALLYLFTTQGLGVFISTITSSQQQALFVSWFFMVFMLLMSGLFIPIENMPVVLQKITYLNPMRYFMYIIREIFQKGASLQHLWEDVIPMTVLGLMIFTFSILKFHKRIE